MILFDYCWVIERNHKRNHFFSIQNSYSVASFISILQRRISNVFTADFQLFLHPFHIIIYSIL